MLHPEKREKIMRAAERLFTTRRFHEITTDAIAREAGVGKGTIYRYFKDKDDLFHETAMHGFEELCTLLERKGTNQQSIKHQLLEACERIGGFFESRRRLHRLIQDEETRLAFMRGPSHEQWRERRRRLIGIVGSVLAHGVERGEIRGDLPVDRLAGFLLGMLRSRARESSSDAGATVSYQQVVDFFLTGAAARAQPVDDGLAGGLPAVTKRGDR